jgi:nucleotide-binding universal stress UspA family protein
MFRNILLPVDLTDKHGQALEAAADLVRQSGGEVTLLHIIEVIPGLEMEEEKTFYARLEKSARKHLAGLGGKLEGKGIRWRAEVRFGARGPDIVRYAGESGADLIVLTSPRFDPDRPAAGWGSLSHKLGILSGCPVLLVK